MDGRGYGSYKRVSGVWNLGVASLHVDKVQRDPFAPPSLMRASVPMGAAGLPDWALCSRTARRATSDFLTRAFGSLASGIRGSGTGNSGRITIDSCGQEILERTSMVVSEEGVEARFRVGLPAGGRRVLGRSAAELLTGTLPKLLEGSMLLSSLDAGALREHVRCCEDQVVLREILGQVGLVAFVGDGSVLARASGASDLPMTSGALPFRSPEELAVTVDLPGAGSVRGMGVRSGITLVTGGGYHGKSTLLRAVERSVYDHVPGDGRELVATVPSAMKVRAEDGRSVAAVDISPFIGELPDGQDTTAFTSPNASGSTSQAAGIVEAVEAGAELLLLDEDTCATNFMIRDARMQRLIPERLEPITPFIDRVGQLLSGWGVSTLMVLGGSGDYLDVAGDVIVMESYLPREATEEARRVAAELGTGRKVAEVPPLGERPSRRLDPSCLRLGHRDRVRARGTRSVSLGRRREIDVSLVEQLVDPSQARAIGEVLRLLGDAEPGAPLAAAVDRLLERVSERGLDMLSPFDGHPGELALPRKQEVCATLSRLRSLRIEMEG